MDPPRLEDGASNNSIIVRIFTYAQKSIKKVNELITESQGVFILTYEPMRNIFHLGMTKIYIAKLKKHYVIDDTRKAPNCVTKMYQCQMCHFFFILEF